MNMQAEKGKKLQLEVRIVDAKPQAHFCYEGQEYSTIHLAGDCEDIMIGEWEESLCSWALLEVLWDVPQGTKSLRVSLLGNGFAPQDRAILEHVVREANAVIGRMKSTTLDITKELFSLGWDVVLSTEAISNRNPNL